MNKNQAKTHNVFLNKAGELHVETASTVRKSESVVFTRGIWNGSTILAGYRTLDRKNLTPAGTLTVVNQTNTYNADAKHI